MTDSMRTVSAGLLKYLRRVSLREPDVVRKLRDATDALPEAGWASTPEQCQFLALLIEMIDARRVLEVGTFTGYGTLWMGLSLPDDGEIVTCDMVDDYVNVGRPFWNEAGVANKIEVRLAPAEESLQDLIDEGKTGTFDFAFIDANKKGYPTYYELVLDLVRPGGVIAFDNMFWGGAVLHDNDTSKATRALRGLAEKLHSDERVSISMLPVNDGLSIAVKRR